MPASSLRPAYFRHFLLLLALLMLILSLSRPQIGTKLITAKRRGIDLLFVLDVSTSMLAEDIKPNRLERAKQEIADLVKNLKGDRVGLVIFAGESFVQCPLTTDYGCFLMFLAGVNTESISPQGTAIAKALKKATKTFTLKQKKHKAIILLTDGEDHPGKVLEAAKETAQEGIKIYCIGLGNPEGEPIPLRNAAGKIVGYKKDKKGEIVMTRLDQLTLQKIALLTKGKYYHSDENLKKILEDIAQIEKRELKSIQLREYEERFQYFLILGIIFLLWEFLLKGRRKK
jgi:Ca-activated chloride channel family protein